MANICGYPIYFKTYISHTTSFNTPVSIGPTTLAHMLNGYKCRRYVSIQQTLIFNTQNFRYIRYAPPFWTVLVRWYPTLCRVPTDLKSQGKTWKNKTVKESQGTFLFLQKKSEYFKMLIIMKLKNVIFMWKMLWLSFHTPCKTSSKMLKMVRDICVPVRENISEKASTSFRFFVGTLVC